MTYKVNGSIVEIDIEEWNQNKKDFPDMSEDDLARMYFEDAGYVEGGELANIVRVDDPPKKRNYVKSDKPKTKKKVEPKSDPYKAALINSLRDWAETLVLDDGTELADIVVNNEASIDFTYNGVEFTIKLVKHRPPKNK